MKKSNYYYMLVDLEDNELPLAIADSPTELARMLNMNSKNIKSIILYHEKNGSKSQYVRVLKD